LAQQSPVRIENLHLLEQDGQVELSDADSCFSKLHVDESCFLVVLILDKLVRIL